ncbi:hypothetical protein TNCV_1939241 [Trichonephila clavipes]|nr:hypothetical protein TNCV_1939241 [Trichonephila clavipes]
MKMPDNILDIIDSQEVGLFTAQQVSARTVRQRLQQHADHYCEFPNHSSTDTHNNRGAHQRQNWIQEWHHIVFSDESRFCVQHYDGHICILGVSAFVACIHYNLIYPVSDIMIWETIGYTTRTPFVPVVSSLLHF